MFEALEVGQVSSFQGSVGRAVVVIGPGGSVILLLKVLWLGLRSCLVQVDLYLFAKGSVVGAVCVFGPGGPVFNS